MVGITRGFSLSFAIVLALAAPVLAQSLGELQVTPTRVVFDGAKRFEVLTLTNRGVDTATYQISVIQYRMNREGRLEMIEAPDSGQLFATDLVRFYPRSVMIPPGETQNIRVQLRLPSTLPPGEYRSHFAFNKVAEAIAPEPDTSSNDEFSVHVKALYGVSIPVIVRNGDLNAQVTVLHPVIDRSREYPVVTFALGRSGSRSVFGNVSVHHRAADGTRTRLGGANGVAVYTPIPERDVSIQLDLPEGHALKGGTLEIEYRTRTEDGDDLMAKGDVPIP